MAFKYLESKMKGRRKGTAKVERVKKLLEDCMVLCVALVLTEPHTTPKQRALVPKLIKRLKAELRGDPQR